jgi:hypothetical protein
MEERLSKSKPAYSLLNITKYYLKPGTWGFGSGAVGAGAIGSTIRHIHRLCSLQVRRRNAGRTGICAAVFLVASVIIIGFCSTIDIPTSLLSIAAVLSLLYIKKIQEQYIIGIAAIIGLLIKTI